MDFDITEFSDIVTVAENYSILSNSSSNWTTNNWTFTIIFINLETNQKENAGKMISGKIYIQQTEMKFNDATVSFINSSKKYTSSANLKCNNNEVVYDKRYRELNIKNLNRTRCMVEYIESERNLIFSEFLIGLSNTNSAQGTGKIIHEIYVDPWKNNIDTGYRYEGKNPNNYVWFNNELWRIIGVFDENTHGSVGQNLVKIIRSEPLGNLVWDKSNVNNWETSDINNILNNYYYYSLDGTNSDHCIGVSATNLILYENCNYTKSGINVDYRNMVKKSLWHLGETLNVGVTSGEMYKYERGTAVGSNTGNSTEVINNIGLMYASDYGYSVLESDCSRSTRLGAYNESQSCAGASWLYGIGNEWTITTSNTNSRTVFGIVTEGRLHSPDARYTYLFRPTLYLNENTILIEGDGSINNPYIIGM